MNSLGSLSDRSNINLKTEINFRPKSMYKIREISNQQILNSSDSKDKGSISMKSIYHSFHVNTEESPRLSYRASHSSWMKHRLHECKVMLKEINNQKKLVETIKNKISCLGSKFISMSFVDQPEKKPVRSRKYTCFE